LPPCLDPPDLQCQIGSVSSSALAVAARPVQSGRWGRAAVCGVLVLAQMLAFSHVARVAHRICAEHGEAIHTSQPAAAATLLAQDTRVSVVPAGETAVGHDHEHCLCMAHGRERFVVPPRTSDGPVRMGIAQLWQGSLLSTLALPVALFLLAPKGSPPASL
jgi:hypothetical protein